MGKVKVFVKEHKVVTASIFLVLVCVIVGGVFSYRLYEQHQRQLKFERDHPLVNRVYKFYYKEKPYNGDWKTTTGYYVFGNNDYRNKVVEIKNDDGGLKQVQKMLHNQGEYKKEFDGNDASSYVVKNGYELLIDPKVEYNYRIKDGKNWTGNYNPDTGKNEETSGEVHRLTPVHIK